MEKDETPSEHRKNKARISIINIGGNIGFGGLVLLGGAFAVTSLIAVFAVKRRRRRDAADKKDLLRKREVKGSQDPRVVPQNQNPFSTFHQNPCLTDGSTGMVAEVETQIDSIEPVSTESLILEENPASVINVENENSASDDQEIILTDDPKQEMVITSCDDCCGVQEENSSSMINDEIENFAGEDQEILLNDDPKQEMIIASCDDCCSVEELPLQVLDDKLMNEVEDKMIKNDSTENSSWLERIELQRQEEERNMEEEIKSVSLVEEVEEELGRVEGEGEKGHSNEEYVMEEEAVLGAEKLLTAETTVAMHLVEGEEEDSSEEYVMDGSSESSEGTGRTSTETNAEAIWPTESIEVLSLEFKNTTLNTQSSGEKIVEEDGSTKTQKFGDSMEALPLEVRNTSVNLQHAESKEKNVEEDRSNKTEQFGNFNNSKSTIPNNDTENHETSKNLMSLKKKEMPELVEVNNQTAELTRRKFWFCSVFLLAFLLLLLFSHRNALSYHVVNGNPFSVHEF